MVGRVGNAGSVGGGRSISYPAPGHDAAAAGLRVGARRRCGAVRHIATRTVNRPARSARAFGGCLGPLWERGGRGVVVEMGWERAETPMRIAARTAGRDGCAEPGVRACPLPRRSAIVAAAAPTSRSACAAARRTLCPTRGYAPDPRCPCSRLTLPSRDCGLPHSRDAARPHARARPPAVILLVVRVHSSNLFRVYKQASRRYIRAPSPPGAVSRSPGGTPRRAPLRRTPPRSTSRYSPSPPSSPGAPRRCRSRSARRGRGGARPAG